jgi:diguanylate cyclase (GGDEF)-like protein
LQPIKAFFAIPADKPDLVMAQLRAFSRQIPLLYVILLLNMAFVSVTHWGVAPGWLVAGLPGLFGVAAIARIIAWWRTRHESYTPEQARKRLITTIWLSGLFGTLLTGWALLLLPYGNAMQQGHMAFFMAATLIGCTFCLMHLRAAAFLLALLVAVPFTIRFFMLPSHVTWAIAANFIIVCGTILYILSVNHDDFATMIAQRADLERRNAETRKLSDENFRLANMDSLTGMPNRRSFIAAIRAKAEESNLTRKPFAVGLIDLDGFKAVNDLYGHAAGDALLREASRRLTELGCENTAFARLGGDEFGFIAEPIHTLGALGKSICSALGTPYVIDGISAEISASCGMALFPATCSSATELLEFADYALYQAKNDAPGTAIIFNGSHRDQLRIAHQVDQALRNADLEQEMRLVYQPVIDSKTGAVHAVEALARWSNEELGQIGPAQFIATAERSPLINKITLVLLNRLLQDLPSLPPELRVSFNLSPMSLCCAQTMLMILAAIQRSGVDPARIEIEVTETALMTKFETALRSMSLLRNLGCTIALDDFGTGYSSLSYVHELPLDKLKIDRRFVTKAGSDPKAHNIVKTILGLSRDLGLKCVAEGVENAEQAAMLSQAGCQFLQGYHFSKPLPLCDLTTHLAQNRSAARTSAG